MTFPCTLFAPHINKLPVPVLQDINQFGIRCPEEFIKTRIVAGSEIENKLVHGGQQAEKYDVSIVR